LAHLHRIHRSRPRYRLIRCVCRQALLARRIALRGAIEKCQHLPIRQLCAGVQISMMHWRLHQVPSGILLLSCNRRRRSGCRRTARRTPLGSASADGDGESENRCKVAFHKNRSTRRAPLLPRPAAFTISAGNRIARFLPHFPTVTCDTNPPPSEIFLPYPIPLAASIRSGFRRQINASILKEHAAKYDPRFQMIRC
jgi:hypothetical protein